MAEIMDFTSRLIERPPPAAAAAVDTAHREQAERTWRVVKRVIARGGCVRRVSLGDNAFVELHRGPPGWAGFGQPPGAHRARPPARGAPHGARRRAGAVAGR